MSIETKIENKGDGVITKTIVIGGYRINHFNEDSRKWKILNIPCRMGLTFPMGTITIDRKQARKNVYKTLKKLEQLQESGEISDKFLFPRIAEPLPNKVRDYLGKKGISEHEIICTRNIEGIVNGSALEVHDFAGLARLDKILHQNNIFRVDLKIENDGKLDDKIFGADFEHNNELFVKHRNYERFKNYMKGFEMESKGAWINRDKFMVYKKEYIRGQKYLLSNKDFLDGIKGASRLNMLIRPLKPLYSFLAKRLSNH